MTRLRERAIKVVGAHPRLESVARRAHADYEMLRHSVAKRIPTVIKPRNHKIMVAVTAHCNARCIGCRYGRDFMPGHQLSLEMVEGVLADASEAGFHVIRFYGGEPLLHPDLPKMVESCRNHRVQPYVTTNAVILDKKVDDLVAAGLRDVTVGFYGVGKAYDDYTQRKGLFEKVERGIATARERHGDKLDMQINWLLMRPTCNLDALHAACEFADRYNLRIQLEMIHYSLPYFQEGPDNMLQFRPEDEPKIRTVVDELLKIKRARPDFINQAETTIRSMPDWLLKGPAMRIPCTAYEMVWVGADGSVQLCYVTFDLGNLHDTRFKDMLKSKARADAARCAFTLDCPNCHCGANDRILRHRASRARYAE